MKLTFKQIEPFVQNPDPKARVILIFGPDQGLMTERSKIICKSQVADLNDPFNVVTFTPDKLNADPSLFYDEVNAQSLMGGNRLIIIKQGTDSINIIIKEYLENPSSDTLVVIEADNLTTRSSLRKLIEGAKNAAALPCYVDDERDLSQIIRNMTQHAGYRIDSDALQLFSSALVGNRTIARAEIEKLLLFKGLKSGYIGFEAEAIRENIGQITMRDIYASCGDVRDWSMDKLVYAIGDGDIQGTHNVIESLIKDQVAPIILLRSVQNHFWRLLSVKSKMNDGMPQDDAVKTLNPPLFWKVKNVFQSQLNRWPISVLESALDSLNKAEAMSKQTGYVDVSLIQNCLIQLARFNPRRHMT